MGERTLSMKASVAKFQPGLQNTFSKTGTKDYKLVVNCDFPDKI